MSDELHAGCVLGIIGLIVLLFIGGCTVSIVAANDIQYHDVTVKKTESVASGKSGHQYRVYTDNGVFQVEDSWWWHRWNSADIYGSLVPGQRYRIKTAGWRFSFFSWFPNILEVTPLESEQVSTQGGGS